MKNPKIVKALTYFYLIPFFVMIFFNIVNSLLRTTYFDLYQYMETAKYKWDNPLFVLCISLLILVFLYFLFQSKWIHQADILKTAICFSGMISLLFVLMFRGEVTCDSASLSDIAIDFLKGNYETFEQGGYLYSYTFQLGVTALLEAVYFIFGIENYLAFQLMNIVAVMVMTGMVNRITGELFEHQQIQKIEAVLSMGMLPLFLFTTFVYGDLIGWAFGICAIYYMIRYLKTDGWHDILKAVFLLSIGIIVKPNINILVVAVVIALVLHAMQKRQYKLLIWGLVMILLSQLGTGIVNAVYVQRAGLEEIPKGIPKIAWIAMSMQETDEGGYACGWYNSYNWAVYEQNGYDREATSRVCMENLEASMNKFIHEQRYSLNFFYKKYTSQWNAPTFQSMITNEWSSRYVEQLSPVAKFFIYGYGRTILYEIMNSYHFFIFLCTGVFCFFKRKSWRLEQAYFILNIFGGFFFHMIWEAQARYILGYFILLLPLAACGCHIILTKCDSLRKLRKQKHERTGISL